MRIVQFIFSFIFLLMFLSALETRITAQKKPSIAAADIQEIILETGDGFCFDCERLTTLRANDGRANYHGGKKSRVRIGDFSGDFAAKDFTKLGQEFIDNGFFDLESFYKGTTSDAATVKITVVFKDDRKTVENFKRSDEPRLKKIEQIFNAATGKIIWHAMDKTQETFHGDF